MSILKRKLKILVALVFVFSGHAYAQCEDLSTTKAIVEYVCAYELVSPTQCRMWREDIRQMSNNTEVIVNSFISWNEESEHSLKLIADY